VPSQAVGDDERVTDRDSAIESAKVAVVTAGIWVAIIGGLAVLAWAINLLLGAGFYNHQI
jgi:hypothetical protein